MNYSHPPDRRLRSASPQDYDLMLGLSSKKLSLTQPRLQVFHALRDRGASKTTEILAACPASSRASIYRTLKLFRQQGVIQDVVIGGQRKIELTDRYSRHHHHLSCTQCGRTLSFGSQKLEQTIQEIARLKGFRETGHQIEISGRCPACQSK